MHKRFSRESINKMEQRYRANFINCLSGFKSANLVGTRSSENINNLCVVSSVFHVGANPPLMGMLMRPHTVVRDTLQNIKDTGEYTINHVNDDIVEPAHQSSARYDSSQSEFEQCKLSPVFSESISAPYVKESHIRIGLKLRQLQEIELNQTELVIGEIVELYVNDQWIHEDGYVDIEAAKSIAVSGLDSYHKTQRKDRLSYAKCENWPTSIWSNK